MQALIAYYESIDPAGALVNIAGVPDTMLNVSGDNITIPGALPNIVGEACLINDASAAAARIQSPSLRIISNLDIEPIVASAAVFGSPPEGLMHPLNPTPVVPDEFLEFLCNSAPTGAQLHYGLVWLSDGPQPPVNGNIYTLRATGAITQTATGWVPGNMTFGQDLPVGRYQVVGLRVRSVAGIAARLLFHGVAWRPGVPVVNAIADLDSRWFRYGRMGILGEFDHNLPPQLEMLGGTSTSQVVFMDIIKVG